MELDTIMRPYAPAQDSPDIAPRADEFDLYSLIPFAEDFRSRAEERRCFYSSESACQVTWIDVDTAGVVGESRLHSMAELRAHRYRHCPQGNGLRILSINQRNSWRPLNVTREMFEEIVDIAGASSDLLELPLSFFQKNNPVEEGYNSAPVFRLHANSIEIVYIFKYAFEKPLEEKGKDPWVLRQTGVYHKYDFTTKNSTLVFLNPTQQCQFQTRLMNLVRLQQQQAQLFENPLLIHSVLFGSFCGAWRDYLKHLESRILSIANTTVAAEIDKPLRVNHESLTAVRSTENRCLVLHPIFRSLEKTCDVLHQANATLAGSGTTQEHALQAMKQLLNNYSASISAYGQAAWSLQNRTSRIACHITDTLSFKDAYIAKRQTEFMLRDSTTVRVITVVTLIYLPSTFMATLLGMNSFFEMDENRRIVVAPQFWIYVVCAIPLTAATLCYWWYFQRSKQRKEPSATDALMV